MKYDYKVEGMHCAACAASIERIVKKLPFVDEVSVNLINEEASILADHNYDEEKVIATVKKAGFTLLTNKQEMSQTFQVAGMTCASCSAAVERILKRQPDIKTAQVNLIMNTVCITYYEYHVHEWKKALEKAGFTLRSDTIMTDVTLRMDAIQDATAFKNALIQNKGIENIDLDVATRIVCIRYDKKVIKQREIMDAIQALGYHGEIKKDVVVKKVQRDYEKVRVYGTLLLAVVLLYIGMAHMLDMVRLPLPAILQKQPINAWVQWFFATAILIVGYRFFVRGIRALWHKVPNMDTLVALGTGSAYVYSCYSLLMLMSGHMQAAHALYFESAGVVVALVQFGKHLESITKKKSTSAISALLQLRPNTAILYRDGKEIEVDVDDIVVQDTILLRAGDHIPVDGVLLEGSSNVDESMLTGESMPIKKHVNDPLIQGTINLDGKVLMECRAIQDETTLSKIIHLVEEAQSKKAPIARIADRISLYFVPTVIVIAILACIGWLLYTRDMSFSLTVFVSVLVIACPCALGLATPTAIMVGSGKAASAGIFMKSGAALEIAGRVDTIVFDKTGTITQGKPVLTDIATKGSDEEILCMAASLEKGSAHPFAHAILKKAEEKKLSLPELKDIQTRNGRGLLAYEKKRPLLIGNRAFMEEEGVETKEYHAKEQFYQSQGKSVVWVAYDGATLGILAIGDHSKPGVREVMERLKKRGLNIYMITGDHQINANMVAQEAGIEHVIAQVLPQDKGEEIKKLQQEGKKVAMVGDGINDAIALTQSDVGIAIGSGSDVAIESGDIVLMKDDLENVETAIRLSTAVIHNIHQNLFWAFFYNIIGIPIAAGVLHLFGGPLLSPVFAGAAMALSSLSVVSNALRLKKFH